jgi:uncharacterized protein YecE (DUF72 family)
MKKGKVYIGTSGWHYKHWRGTFYPPDLKSSQHFEYYSRCFNTVEVNNSFYKLPQKSTFTAWGEAAPDNFLFAVKGSRFITHAKKLKVEPGSISMFFEHTRALKHKCGPILFQLPPHWKVNAERLEEFLRHLPADFRYAVEFRNSTWYTKEVYNILRKYDVMFCIYELDGHTSPLEVTASGVYIRLHGPGAKYQGSYSDEVLGNWADRIQRWARGGRDVYLYFDNDQEGFAAFNAGTLLQMLKISPPQKAPANSRVTKVIKKKKKSSRKVPL